jgi:hypothetical protein
LNGFNGDLASVVGQYDFGARLAVCGRQNYNCGGREVGYRNDDGRPN